MGTANVPGFESLEVNIECDVCIVGAGITGLTTAYMLTCSGKKVVVVDDGSIGGGEIFKITRKKKICRFINNTGNH